MDRVIIEGLELDCIIGVHEYEGHYRQRLILDLEMACDTRASAANDDLALTLDYHAVCRRLVRFAQQERVALLETLADRMARIVLDEFATPYVRMHLRKPGAVAGARSVGVRIERGLVDHG